MSKKSLKKPVIIAADFETTVYPWQTSTEVWSAAWIELFTEQPHVRGNIEDFLNDMFNLNKNVLCYFHNLRFDGAFIVYWLLKNGYTWNNTRNKDMNAKEFKALISDTNKWYTVTVKPKFDTVIEFRDSVKLMPMTLAQIGSAFNTQHRKLEMEYIGMRHANCEITPEEYAYIINDIYVLKEALEVMIKSGHDKLTIGSCCMDEFRNKFDAMDFNAAFPNLKDIALIKYERGSDNVDEYIRKAYKGGYCYYKYKQRKHIRQNGITFDVNSLYPSVMHSKSGNYYPTGKPIFFEKAIPYKCLETRVYPFYVRLRCRFKLKDGFLPTVQIKGDYRYNSTQWLETSDIYYRGKYYRYFTNKEGQKEEARPELTLFMTDYLLLLEHYDVYDLEILDGCYFHGAIGLFDTYIDHYMKIKMTTKDKGERTEAKLFLNNLYGRLAINDNSSYREPFIDPETDSLGFELHSEHEKDTLYIAAGAAVTAYARYFTITHAQANYENFVYSDTDSIHMLDDGKPVKLIKEHATELLHWKRESDWSSAIFIRQKTYAEFVQKEDGKKVTGHWEIKCAGMPEKSKKLFLASHPITDFKIGLKVGGKLKPKYISGGMVLVEDFYTLRAKRC